MPACSVEAEVDLLAQGVGHDLPVDLDARVLHHGVEDGVVVVAGGQGRNAADHMELGLVGVGDHFAVVDAAHLAQAAAGQQAHADCGAQSAGNNSFDVHFHALLS